MNWPEKPLIPKDQGISVSISIDISTSISPGTDISISIIVSISVGISIIFGVSIRTKYKKCFVSTSVGMNITICYYWYYY